MDVDILFALALLAFYLATQILGRKKRLPEAPPAEGADSHEYQQQHSAEVDDAIREIREALGWPSQQQPTSPEPSALPPRTQSPSTQPQSGRPAERKTRLEETRTVRPSRTLERPKFLGEESSENEWEVAQRRTAEKKAAVTARYGAQKGIPEVKAPSQKGAIHPIALKLRSHQGARDAVIYSEIFLPRWKNDSH
jgi:hypothetical protein